VGKIRSIHADYKRVQRDYEQLQGIVRSDAQARSPSLLLYYSWVIQQSMSLKYEPASEPLHISAEWLFLN